MTMSTEIPEPRVQDALDNPFWSSLRSLHRGIALRAGDASRYPAEYAPFLGVASAQADVAAAIDTLGGADESV